MPSGQLHSTVLREIAEGVPYATVEVFGPTLEFVSGPDDPAADFWVMRGVLPAGVADAHRNVSDEPAVELVVTNARLGRFFQEVARSDTRQPPTPAELAEFVAVATRYGYDLGTPEQNAAVGITLSF